MSNRNLNLAAPRLPAAKRRFALRIAAAAVVAACCTLAPLAARAEIADGGTVTGRARPRAATTELRIASPQPPGQDVAQQPLPTLGAPREIRPSNASTGLNMGGNVSASWSSAGIQIQVDSVSNDNSDGTSGTLRLELWATTTPPVFGNDVTYNALGPAYVLGTLDAGSQFSNVDSGLMTPYTPPPDGCYFLTVALEEFDGTQYNYVDLVTFASGADGVPDPGGSGFYLYPFGVPLGSCSGSSANCTRDAATACLVNGRFKVTASYANASAHGSGTVMTFGGKRAESDRSVFLSFTDPSNFELGLKILPACGVNHHYWVYIGGVTNQGWTVNIEDTSNGHTKTYSNKVNHLTSTTADIRALACP
ncbi:MAG TPA: hypothetical protein VHG32_22725 [Thermoanaerobaculia bacterium]|jgi:hypothetical protein|nr:hypothetical protein [Thermoanaerobaculia bacterium]